MRAQLMRPLQPRLPPPLSPSGGSSEAQEAAAAPQVDDAEFVVKRRKRGEAPTCRVPMCTSELETPFHQKYRICPRHYKAPSIHVDGAQWRFCQQV